MLLSHPTLFSVKNTVLFSLKILSSETPDKKIKKIKQRFVPVFKKASSSQWFFKKSPALLLVFFKKNLLF
jgi:hypothetical protein